jgi:hypothetical protein
MFLPLVKIDGQPRALWFRYTYYLTVEDVAKGKNHVKRYRKLAKQKIFRQFDSYYKFVELNREPIKLRRWSGEI